MNKSAALVAVILLLALVSPAMAGIEPVPWRSELGVLNSIVNCLSEVSQRINTGATRMGIEPSPFRSLVNQLEAKAHQLDVLQRRLEDVLDAISSEDDVVREEVVSALQDVKRGAEQIVEQTQSEKWPEQATEVLGRIRSSAQAMVDLIEGPGPGH